MTIKNLTTLAIIYSLIQVLPVSAEVVFKNSSADCQFEGVICKAKNVGANIAGNRYVSSKMHSNCSAKTYKKPTPAPWSEILSDLSKGESLTNAFYVFEASDLTIASSEKDNLDYDTISDIDAQNCNVDEVPIPAAGWLFASALLGFITFSNRHRV